MSLAQQIAHDVDTGISIAYHQYPRVYLGMSGLGDPCIRKVYFQWRFARQKVWSPRMTRLLDRGHREEERVIDWLRLANYKVLSKDPETGQQFEYVQHHGHVKGHCDGKVLIRGKWYVLEIKTHNKESFLKTKRANDINISKPVHYTQCQSYMECEGTKGALYVAVCKNTDAIHWEIVKQDKSTIQWLEERTLALLTTRVIPPRIVDEPGYWLCNLCDFKDICFDGEDPDATCRLCRHVQLGEEGTWQCLKRNINAIRLNVQLTGCPDHQYI